MPRDATPLRLLVALLLVKGTHASAHSYSCDCRWALGGCGSNDGSHCWAVCCGDELPLDRSTTFALSTRRTEDCDSSDSGPTLIFTLLLVLGLFSFTLLLARALTRSGAGAVSHTVQKLLAGIAVASLTVVLTCALWGLFAVLDDYCLAAAACAFGLVPLISSAVLLAVSTRAPSVSTSLPLGLFFTVWGVLSTFVLTFVGPFLVTSNAYLATWLALGCAYAMVASSVEARAAELGARAAGGSKRSLLGLLVCSVVLLGVSVTHLSTSDEALYLLVGAVLSACAAVYALVRPPPPLWRTVLFLLLALLWASLVWFATFAGPFGLTGNGFFATWLGLACATQLVLHDAGRSEADASAGDVRAAARQHTLVLVGVASSVLVLSSAGGREGYGLYALVAGAVSLALVLVACLHRALKPEDAAELASTVLCRQRLGKQRDWTCESSLALFLTLWWLAAVVALTFFGPLAVTSNAWFACWAALGGSATLLVERGARPILNVERGARSSSSAADDDAPTAADDGGWPTCFWLLLSSATLFVACVAGPRASSAQSLWALIASAATALLACALLFTSCVAAGTARTAVAASLVAVWLSVVWFTTFDGDFHLTGNGFFAAWLGLACALRLLCEAERVRALACWQRCAGVDGAAGAGSAHRGEERASLSMAAKVSEQSAHLAEQVEPEQEQHVHVEVDGGEAPKPPDPPPDPYTSVD